MYLVKVKSIVKIGILVELKSLNIDSKTIYLTYSPIHGKMKDIYKRPALRKAIENDYS